MKVKDKELRIGNYVFEPKGHLHRVERTSEDTNRVRHAILIDEGWMLKLGFKSGNNDSYYIEIFEDDCHVYFTIYKDWSWSIGIPYESGGTDLKVKSVHQLQNLYFALTNKELEVN